MEIRKILIVITTGMASYGGLTTVMMNYYRAMDRSGLKIDFASTNIPEDELLDELHRNGSEYHCLGDRKKKLLEYRRNLKKILKENQYDVIHVNGNSATMAIELSVAKKCGVAVRIAHGHNSQTSHPLANRLLDKPFKKSFTYAVTVSKEAGNWLYGKDKYIVLNNAIDLDRYRFNEQKRNEVRERLNINDKFVVGNVGKLNKQKNHTFLIDIFSEVKKIHPDACLLSVGGGALEQPLKEKCKKLGIEKDVIFTGMVNDASEYFQAMDIFVFPSVFEGLGLALIEAQASGLICMASDVVPRETRVSDLIHYIGLERSSKEWCDDVLRGITPDREKHAQAARESIKSHGYDIDMEANKLRAIYVSR